MAAALFVRRDPSTVAGILTCSYDWIAVWTQTAVLVDSAHTVAGPVDIDKCRRQT